MADGKKPTLFEAYSRRLAASSKTYRTPEGASVREAHHLFMGWEYARHIPMLVHRNDLAYHVHITGSTGSGKTALGIIPLYLQLIRGYRTVAGEPADREGYSLMPPIVIIDLKGERALLNAVRHAVAEKAPKELGRDGKARRPQDAFRLLSVEAGLPTHKFNPFGSLFTDPDHIVNACTVFMNALELHHGPGYGRQYFSARSLSLLRSIVRAEQPRSFTQLFEHIQDLGREERHDAFEIISTLEGLTEYDQLHPAPDEPRQNLITPEDVIEDRQVVYVWAPTPIEGITARHVANLFLFSFWNALQKARRRHDGGGAAPIQSYCFIDEFQEIVGERFAQAMNLARDSGLAFILSNQTNASLAQPDSRRIAEVIEADTNVKLMFSVPTIEEKQRIRDDSGQTVAYMRSGIFGGFGTNFDHPLALGWTHTLKPKITIDDINRNINSHALRYLLHLRQSAGVFQFGGSYLPVQTTYPVHEAVYKQWSRGEPWPTADQLGLVAAKPRRSPAKSPKDIDDQVQTRVAELVRRKNRLRKQFPASQRLENEPPRRRRRKDRGPKKKKAP